MNHLKRTRILAALTLITLLLAGCDLLVTPLARRLTLEIAFPADIHQELMIDFTLFNEGDALPADDQFESQWQITDSGGAAAAGGVFHQRQALEEGERAHILTWSGQLPPGRHTLRWEAPGYGATEVQFAVEQAEDGLRLVEPAARHSYAEPDTP